MLLLASATAYAQNQPPAQPTAPVNVIIVIQTQPGSPGGSGTLVLPGGVNITTMTVPPGAVRIGPVAVTPVKPSAKTPPKPVIYKPGDKFGRLDADKDGKLSRAEFKGPRNVFASVDADHDGYISKPEATRAYLAFVGHLAIEKKAQAFKAMDANHDGKLSETEFKGTRPLFAAIDTNHDGFVTRAEAAKTFEDHVHVAMVVAGLKAMDKNKDGKLTPEEFTGSIAQFLKLDVDKDGVITKGDVTKVLTTGIVAKAKTPAAAPAIRPTVTPPAAAKPVHAATATSSAATKPIDQTLAPRPGPFLRRVFAALDTDKDGKVSKSEYVDHAMNRFTKIDTNKDGILSQDELKAARTRTRIGARVRSTRASSTRPLTSPGRSFGAGLARYDADKDGTVSKDEYTRGINTRFARLDVDKDGVITAADISRVIQVRGARPTVPPAATAKPAAPHAVAIPTHKAVKPNPGVKG